MEKVYGHCLYTGICNAILLTGGRSDEHEFCVSRDRAVKLGVPEKEEEARALTKKVLAQFSFVALYYRTPTRGPPETLVVQAGTVYFLLVENLHENTMKHWCILASDKQRLFLNNYIDWNLGDFVCVSWSRRLDFRGCTFRCNGRYVKVEYKVVEWCVVRRNL